MVDNTETAADSGTEDLAPSCLLEFAADNDLSRFRQQVVEAGADIDEPGFWYCRHNGANHHRMVLEQRTPAMIAALYGSYEVLSYILRCYHSSGRDVNRRCGSDSVTALHCAASGASKSAMEIIRLLLDFGADPLSLDAHGCRPIDVIRVFPGAASHMKADLEATLLAGATPCPGEVNTGSVYDMLGVEVGVKEAMKPIRIPKLTSSPESSVLSSSPDSPTAAADGFLEKPALREYCPIVTVAGGDPTLPDVKNSIYSTDEFRMFSFKVRQCSRAYSHDWTECPFVHPGENARRRDPRRYHYSCVPCPEFRKGCCKRGDLCEYAHGVFECWLHPAQYRTRLCKDGIACARRVCFFAHTTDELRPLYISTGSAVPSSSSSSSSPRAASASCSVDVSSLSPTLGPSSPSVFLQSCSQTPPASPSASSQGGLALWQQQSALPALHLPGLQSSRLRSSRSAREIPAEDMNSPGYYAEFDGQFPSPSQVLSAQARWNAAVAAAASGCGATGGNSSPRVGKYRSLGFSIVPANLEDLFAPETTLSESPPILLNIPLQQQQQQQNHASLLQQQLHSQLLAERNSRAYPQNPIAESRRKLLQSPSRSPSFALSASHSHILPPPLMLDTDRQSNVTPPSSPAALSIITQHDKRSHSSHELGSGLSLSDWGSPTGKPEWGMNREDLTKFRKSAPFGIWAPESEGQAWSQTHVKDSPADLNPGVGVATTTAASTNGLGAGGGEQEETEHLALSSWIEQLRLDQIVA